MKSNIDFSFITELEGYSLTGYVPDPEGSDSGVTIASGFDLGQCAGIALELMFDKNLADKLEPYAGKKKQEAVEYLAEHPLTVTKAEADTINTVVHKESAEKLERTWNKWSGYCKWDDLSTPKATVLASVSFQYGSLPVKTPNFWRQCISSDWSAAVANLRDFGDKYPTRRNKEADLLESDL